MTIKQKKLSPEIVTKWWISAESVFFFLVLDCEEVDFSFQVVKLFIFKILEYWWLGLIQSSSQSRVCWFCLLELASLTVPLSLFPGITIPYSILKKLFLEWLQFQEILAIFQSSFLNLKTNLAHLTARLSVCPSVLIPMFSPSICYHTM